MHTLFHVACICLFIPAVLSGSACSLTGGALDVAAGRVCIIVANMNATSATIYGTALFEDNYFLSISGNFMIANTGSIVGNGDILVGTSTNPANSVQIDGEVRGVNSFTVYAQSALFDTLTLITSISIFKGPGAGSSSNSSAGGAAHGGAGGSAFYNGLPYDSYIKPSLPGSQGGNTSGGSGGAGGGVISIVAQNLTTLGTFSVDAPSTTVGGGSGGSIFIKTNFWNGNATLSANGGSSNDATNRSGSGGGGRIAVHFNTSTFSGSFTAVGGLGAYPAGPGTIFLWDLLTNYKNLTIWNNNSKPLLDQNYIDEFTDTVGGYAWLTESGMSVFDIDDVKILGDGASLAINPTDLPPNQGITMNFAQITGDNGINSFIHVLANQTAHFERVIQPFQISLHSYVGSTIYMPKTVEIANTMYSWGNVLNIDNLYLRSQAVIAMQAGATLSVQKNLTLATQSYISGGKGTVTVGSPANPAQIVRVDGLIAVQQIEIFADAIWLGAQSELRAQSYVSGFGDGGLNATTRLTGAGAHGGSGGAPLASLAGKPYDSYSAPSFPGSLSGNTTVQAGGGVISLHATNISIYGSINAISTIYGATSGPSGGSILINGTFISGNESSISANGGDGTYYGGGGGRIAFYFANISSSTFLGSISCYGGRGAARENDGGAGTVFTQQKDAQLGAISISNNGNGGNLHAPISSMETALSAFTWLTEPGVSIFSLDSIGISQNAALAINPTGVASDKKIQLRLGYLEGQNADGVIHIRNGQELFMKTGQIRASIVVYKNATANFVSPLFIPANATVYLFGDTCGLASIFVTGTLVLSGSGSTCAQASNGTYAHTNSPGNFSVTNIVVDDGGVLTSTSPSRLDAIVCTYPKAVINDTAINFQTPPRDFNVSDPLCRLITRRTLPVMNCSEGSIWDGYECKQVVVPSCGLNNGGCNYMVKCMEQGGGVVCGPCPVGTVGTGNTVCTSLCGDGNCDHSIGENCVTCPTDCHEASCGQCGDGFCDSTVSEACDTCALDCGSCDASQKCQDNCNNHGKCVEGVCECADLWTGPYCNTRDTQPINVTLNTTNPGGTVVSQNAQFFISIERIVEKGAGGEIRTTSIPSVGFLRTKSNIGLNTINNYTATLENGALLSVVVTQFEEPSTQYEFAGTTMTFPQHTLKFTISIQNWPFLALQNSLWVIFDANVISAKQTSLCANPSENLRWVLLVVDDVSLYGQFLDKSILDGVVRNISVLLNQSDSTVSAVLPHFWNSAEIDPSYSVLLNPFSDNDDGGCTSSIKQPKNNHKTKVAVIASVVTVVGVCLLVALAYSIYKYQKKKKTKSQLVSMQNLVSSQ